MRRKEASAARALSILVVAGLLALAASATGAAAADDPQPVDINRATPEQLMSVKGIGETLAQRIVEFREEHGPYRRVEDLLKVKGIGEKSFEKLRPYLTVGKTP